MSDALASVSININKLFTDHIDRVRYRAHHPDEILSCDVACIAMQSVHRASAPDNTDAAQGLLWQEAGETWRRLLMLESQPRTTIIDVKCTKSFQDVLVWHCVQSCNEAVCEVCLQAKMMIDRKQNDMQRCVRLRRSSADRRGTAQL